VLVQDQSVQQVLKNQNTEQKKELAQAEVQHSGCLAIVCFVSCGESRGGCEQCDMGFVGKPFPSYVFLFWYNLCVCVFVCTIVCVCDVCGWCACMCVYVPLHECVCMNVCMCVRMYVYVRLYVRSEHICHGSTQWYPLLSLHKAYLNTSVHRLAINSLL